MNGDKCFCHFNGYEVKDAAARREIQKILSKIPTLETTIIETNHNLPIKFWAGTKEEFSHLNKEDENTFYIVTDDQKMNKIFYEGNIPFGEMIFGSDFELDDDFNDYPSYQVLVTENIIVDAQLSSQDISGEHYYILRGTAFSAESEEHYTMYGVELRIYAPRNEIASNLSKAFHYVAGELIEVEDLVLSGILGKC